MHFATQSIFLDIYETQKIQSSPEINDFLFRLLSTFVHFNVGFHGILLLLAPAAWFHWDRCIAMKDADIYFRMENFWLKLFGNYSK